jgi:hypothetical protein
MSLRKHFTSDTVVAESLQSDWAQQGYRSEDDARQVSSLVQDLIEHRRHIALSCRDADTLDHYSRLLVRDLRQRESVKVVPYFPSSTEMLLTRLNELLAQVTIEQAMRRDSSHNSDIHVFVLHDTPSLANAELTLLVQLINDLPGTQLRLVLVLDSDDHDHARLPLLGKRARHWDVPALVGAEALVRDKRPSPEQIPVLHDTLAAAGATEPARTGWWQRLGRLVSRNTASAAAAVCLVVLAGLGGLSGSTDPSAPGSLAGAEHRQWGGPIVLASSAANSAPAVAVPAWLTARCAPPSSSAAGVCGTEPS